MTPARNGGGQWRAVWISRLLALPRVLRMVLTGAVLGGAVGLAAAMLWPGAPAAIPGLSMLLGAVVAVLMARRSAKPLTSHGSARLASAEEMEAMEGDEGLIVGRAPEPNGRLLRYRGPGHLITIAPTRAGKGAGAVIPNLLLADRPALVIDPKGENYRATARQRERYGPVYRLDPFGVCGDAAATYNPLDSVRMEKDDLVDDVATLATAIVSDPPGQVKEVHWNEEASALVTGLILHCLSGDSAEERSLARVRHYLTLPPDGFRALIEGMQESTGAGGLVARAAHRRMAQNEREAASILSTAQRHTHFLDSARIVRSTASSGFRFSDIVRQNGTVYLILPLDRIAAYARWLRIIVAQAVDELVRLGAGERARPVLLLLDECAAMGRMTALEKAVGLMAGYGVQIWCVFQDLHQLRSTYGSVAGTFLANAGVVQAFNVNELETARWLSSVLGSMTETYPSGGTGVTMRTARPLLTPDEILNLPDDAVLLTRQEGRPVLARKVRYYDNPEFKGLYENITN